MTTGTPTSSLVSNTLADNATRNLVPSGNRHSSRRGCFILEYSDRTRLRRNVSGQLLDFRFGSFLVLCLAHRRRRIPCFPSLFRNAAHNAATESQPRHIPRHAPKKCFTLASSSPDPTHHATA